MPGGTRMILAATGSFLGKCLRSDFLEFELRIDGAPRSCQQAMAIDEAMYRGSWLLDALYNWSFSGFGCHSSTSGHICLLHWREARREDEVWWKIYDISVSWGNDELWHLLKPQDNCFSMQCLWYKGDVLKPKLKVDSCCQTSDLWSLGYPLVSTSPLSFVHVDIDLFESSCEIFKSHLNGLFLS